MAQHGDDAYVTLLTSDSYLPGVMVLAHSLRDNGTRKKLACMVVMDVLSGNTVNELRSVYDHVIPVERVTNKNPANLYLMDRPDLNSAFTKINLWRQTQYRRLVYIDADVVALRAPDELFDLQAPFSAAPDIGWPDCFNSGVMALTPGMGDYYALKALADRGISFDGADQGLLNMHFRNYNRISFSYNCTPSGNYQYVPAYRHFQSTISLVHFIGREKPWTVGREHGGAAGVYQELLGRWWAQYDRHYRVPDNAAISGQAPPTARTVQNFVVGEQQQQLNGYGYSSTPSIQVQEPSPNLHASQSQPQAAHQNQQKHQHSAPPPPEEPHNESSRDANYAGEPQAIQAPPVVEQRRFSAPHAEWNPAVQAPPPNAKPEAANFPSTTYSMSAERDLWKPPASYPEPPKNMWYEVPQSRSIEPAPRAIFPWEKNQAPATRVFAEERAPSPPPPPPQPAAQPSGVAPISDSELANSPPPAGGDELSVSPPRMSPPGQTPAAPADIFSPTTVPFSEYRGSNAWDDDEGIGRYVSGLQMRRKGGTQVLLHQSFADLGVGGEEQRRASLRITNFPTEVERPSLPVTPAPIRRNMFWGSERDAEGNLPEAEGVPAQMEWNPQQQLDQLRRNSLLFASSSPNASAETPLRQHPASSEEVVTSPDKEVAESVRSTSIGDVSEDATASAQSLASSLAGSATSLDTSKISAPSLPITTAGTPSSIAAVGTKNETAVPSFTTPQYDAKASSSTAADPAAAEDDTAGDPAAP